jgi:hypothetical protein
MIYLLLVVLIVGYHTGNTSDLNLGGKIHISSPVLTEVFHDFPQPHK